MMLLQIAYVNNNTTTCLKPLKCHGDKASFEFGCTTLQGHLLAGEEHFSVEVDENDDVWRDDPWFACLGRSCIHMTWGDRGAISLDGLDLLLVSNPDDADFILAHGTEAIGVPSGDAIPKKLEELEQILEACAQRKIPMVVANPDYVTVEARNLRVMPGTLGAKYEKLGGEVKWMGKPDKVIYKYAMAMAGADPCDCIAVGDSLHHDIKGANAAGIDSVFITGGIHASELGINMTGEIATFTKVNDLANKYDAHPSYVLPSFTW